MTKTTTSRFTIKCDDCDATIGTTDNPARQAEGGRCAECKGTN